MKRSTKEIWIRFLNRGEYEDWKEDLYSLLGQAPGDSQVCVYLQEQRLANKMPKYFDESQIDILTSVFGTEDVVIKESKKEITSRRDVQEYYGDIFGRIADSLEAIETALKEIAEQFRE